MELDLGGLRAFVAVADRRHFGAAADDLGLTQQAVSKRIARLEDALDAVLLRRSATGADPTADGTALLPHARAVLATADQLDRAMRARRRALRVDVVGTRLSTVTLLRAFHETLPDGAGVEIVTSTGLRSAVPALLGGEIDAAYARVATALDARLDHTLAHLEPVYALVGRGHRFAGRRSLPVAELAGTTAWMPGNDPGSEWAAYWSDFADEFGVRFARGRPYFGTDHMVEEVARDPELLTFVGEGTPSHLPEQVDVVRIPVVDPCPVYPTSLVWHRDSRHPLLPALVAHTRGRYRPPSGPVWTPAADRPTLTATNADPRHAPARDTR